MLTFNPVRKTVATNSLEVIYDIIAIKIFLTEEKFKKKWSSDDKGFQKVIVIF